MLLGHRAAVLILAQVLLPTLHVGSQDYSYQASFEYSRLLVRGSHGFKYTAICLHVVPCQLNLRVFQLRNPGPLFPLVWPRSCLEEEEIIINLFLLLPFPVHPHGESKNISLGQRET